MKEYSFLIIFIFATQLCYSQNLVIDGEMEQKVGSSNCPSPYVGMDRSPHWFRAAGSVDFFFNGCEYAEDGFGGLNDWPFWTYDNIYNSFIGFWGAYKTDFSRSSEMAGTTLSTPLETDKFYYFSVETRYRGIHHPNRAIPFYDCQTTIERNLEIYTSNNSDGFETFSDQSSAATAVLDENVLSLPLNAAVDTIPSFYWKRLSGCFQAKGGEQQLAIGLTIGNFEPIYPCDTNRHNEDWFSIYYYNIDNVKLLEYPSSRVDTILLCAEQGAVDIDLEKYFERETLENVSFVWSDGTAGSINKFYEAGFYEAEAILECGKITFGFQVETVKCKGVALVPDAFTPNFDGRNDELLPYFVNDFPITNYEFMVFDRWGNLFYHSDNYDGFTGWNGTFNGKTAPNGVYVWHLKFDLILPEGAEFQQFSGDVLLVR